VNWCRGDIFTITEDATGKPSSLETLISASRSFTIRLWLSCWVPTERLIRKQRTPLTEKDWDV